MVILYCVSNSINQKMVLALAIYKYLYPKASAEKRYLYDTDIEYMITVSDNASFYELLEKIVASKPDTLQRFTKDLGLRKTQIHNQDAKNKYNYQSVTTPYEMAKIYYNQPAEGERQYELVETIPGYWTR